METNEDDKDTLYTMETHESVVRITDCGMNPLQEGSVIKFKSSDVDVQNDLE